ncbi:MAG: hypothetical protein OQK03_12195, partial [Colwellia sp.]|nr:hypothetical protein [Colwellia sp.]
MLKHIILVLLFVYSSNVYSQELSLFQCAEVKKMANLESIATNFSILSQGVSRKDIALNRARGLVRSQ